MYKIVVEEMDQLNYCSCYCPLNSFLNGNILLLISSVYITITDLKYSKMNYLTVNIPYAFDMFEPSN